MNRGQPSSVILPAITAALNKHGITPSRFGRDAVRDPRLVSDLRAGRTIKPHRIARVQAHIAVLEGHHA